jgi:uncharacterized protein YecE (DUF72 family)
VIKVGITSWSDRSLLASGWYPPGTRSTEGRLRYYATQFPLVETDFPYYALPEPRHAEAWVKRTPPGFTMNVKAHALLTEHHTDPQRLPPDLRSELPPELMVKRRLYGRELDVHFLREIAARFREALMPLHQAGRLGAVLAQFPVWVPRSRDADRKILVLQERLAPFRMAVEFRNRTWMDAAHCDETLAFLRAHGISYVCVDEPQGFPSSVPPIAEATAELAMVRMHGRNAARWSRSVERASERFDYLYDEHQLREWVPKARALAAESREVHVLFNNCHHDYAVTNARQMTSLLAEAGEVASRDTRSPSA